MEKQFDINPELLDELEKAINNRKIFPSDRWALKVIFLAAITAILGASNWRLLGKLVIAML